MANRYKELYERYKDIYAPILYDEGTKPKRAKTKKPGDLLKGDKPCNVLFFQNNSSRITEESAPCMSPKGKRTVYDTKVEYIPNDTLLADLEWSKSNLEVCFYLSSFLLPE